MKINRGIIVINRTKPQDPLTHQDGSLTETRNYSAYSTAWVIQSRYDIPVALCG